MNIFSESQRIGTKQHNVMMSSSNYDLCHLNYVLCHLNYDLIKSWVNEQQNEADTKFIL